MNSNCEPQVSAKTADSNWKLLLEKQPNLKKKKCEHGNLTRNTSDKPKSPEVWFDDVDDIFIKKEQALNSTEAASDTLVKRNSFSGITKLIAMDCEMVGVGDEGEDSIVARVSIVNQFGHCIYDKYVKPTEPVVDYRTTVSGIRPSDIENGAEFKVVQKEVYDILQNRILVGHAVHHDLKTLFLSHPRKRIRDTSRYRPFRRVNNGRTPSLKALCAILLGVDVQKGEHSSVQDAQAAMRLYTMHRREWKKQIKKSRCKQSKVKAQKSVE